MNSIGVEVNAYPASSPTHAAIANMVPLKPNSSRLKESRTQKNMETNSIFNFATELATREIH